MMLDFTKMKKKFMTVKLDEDTILYVGTPRKRDLDNMLASKSVLSSEDMSQEDINLAYDMVADLLSNNKNKKKITGEYISDIFGLEDIVIFLEEYMKFVQSAIQTKN